MEPHDLSPDQYRKYRRLKHEYNQLQDVYEILDIIAKVNIREQKKIQSQWAKRPHKRFLGGLIDKIRIKSPLDRIVKPTMNAIVDQYGTRAPGMAIQIIHRFLPRGMKTGFDLEDFIRSNGANYSYNIRMGQEPNEYVRLIQHHIRLRLQELADTQI